MTCPACGQAGLDGRRYCTSCGEALTVACPDCGAPAEPGARFCGDCGVSLAPAPAPERSPVDDPGEQRFVTVLFSDLVGFTTYSEGRDTEEVRQLLTTYFDRAREIIGRFGGVVDKFIGDAVMAVWGAQSIQEDDAESGVRAALEIVDAVAAFGEEIGVPDLAARVGLMSGETSVGSGGNEKGLVVGDLVNTASRLQALAAPGTVVVGNSTRALAAAAIEFEALGDLTVKGKEESIEAWTARRVIAGRGGSRRSDGLVAPFVGREHEMRMLKELLHAVGREQQVRMISIIGDGGTGKSRLIDEFWHYIDGVVDDIYWHVGTSPAYGEGLTFWALGEMVRRRCGILEGDDDHRTMTKLRTALAEYVGDPDDRAWMEPRLAVLLGQDPLEESDRADLFGAWRTFFHNVSVRGTTVMVFDDINRADSGLLEFIDELTSIAVEHPILVITMARPDLLDRAASWGSDRDNSVAIRLGPLSTTTMTSLIGGMVPGIPSELVDRLAAHAAGIPLYGVELVRMLYNRGSIVEDGDGEYRLVDDVTRIDVPDSLHGVVGARIDQLDRGDRDVIQDASVLGQSFTVRALAALRGEPVPALEPRLEAFVGFSLLRLERDPRSPERGHYQFVQSLVREVAYARLTRTERRKRHVQAAEFFAGLGDPELAAAVASHYASALEGAPAAEAADLGGRAAGALLAAAQRAAGLHSHEQAVALCRQALALTTDPLTRGRIQMLATESAHSILREEEAEEWATAAIQSLKEAGDDNMLLAAGSVMARILADTRRVVSATDLLEPLVEAHPGGTVEYARAAADLARISMLRHDFERALVMVEAAAGLAEEFNLSGVVADLMTTRGTVLCTVGRAREGMALLNAALEMAESSDSSRTLRRVLNNLAYFAVADDCRKASAYMQRGYERALKIAEPFWVVTARLDLLSDAIETGIWDRVDTILESPGMEQLVGTDAFLYERLLMTRRLWTEGTNGMEAELDDLVDRFESVLSESPDTAMEAVALRMFIDFLAGRAEEAFSSAIENVDLTPNLTDVDVAMFSAMYLRDPAKVAEATERLAAKVFRGERVETMRMTLEGAALALDGETARAATLLGEAGARAEEFCSRMQAGLTAALAARLIGLDNEIGAELARRAHSICADSRLQAIADLVPDGLLVDHAAAASS